MLRIIIFSFFFILFLFGQEVQQNHITIADSNASPPFDSLASDQNENPEPEFYQLKPFPVHFLTSTDTTFKQSQIISTIYNGFADIFRLRPDFRIYDFLEMGQPRYVAPLHLLPHQSSIFYEGYFLNDPMHGMYNLRFHSLDETESVQVSSSGSITSADGHSSLNSIQINGRVLNTQDPYTRIMFRQGDFGYTDLDIQFARRINDHASIQLGGLNKLNDINQHHGVIYQGALNFQASPKLFSRTEVRVNDDKMKIAGEGDYQLFTYSEEREELLQSFSYLIDPQKKERLHIRAGISGNRRKNSSTVDSFKIKYRFQRAYFNLERNLKTGPLNWIGGLSYNQTQVWGNALETDHNLTNFGGFLTVDYSVVPSINIVPSIKFSKQSGTSALIHTGLTAQYYADSTVQFQIDFRQDQRKPNANEQFFEYENFHGNPGLNHEKITSISARADANTFKLFKIGVFSTYQEIRDEILFDSLSFQNGPTRAFIYAGGRASFKLNPFKIASGGQVSFGKHLIGPEYSAWMQLNYHGVWLKGALIIDAIAQAHYYGPQNRIQYHPIVERFYPGEMQFDPYLTFSYKAVATVKSAQLYVAMDNALGQRYSIIAGYPERYYRIRFGVNWVLWE